MPYMLDTSICIFALRQGPVEVVERLHALSPSEVVVSSITVSELEYGASKSSSPARNRAVVARFLAPLDTAAFDDRAAAVYGHIRATLERRGTPIGPLDFLIAAHALSLGCTLVTHNTREFRRVPGLTVEDWVG